LSLVIDSQCSKHKGTNWKIPVTKAIAKSLDFMRSIVNSRF
jgi:hypothetical protein